MQQCGAMVNPLQNNSDSHTDYNDESEDEQLDTDS